LDYHTNWDATNVEIATSDQKKKKCLTNGNLKGIKLFLQIPNYYKVFVYNKKV